MLIFRKINPYDLDTICELERQSELPFTKKELDEILNTPQNADFMDTYGYIGEACIGPTITPVCYCIYKYISNELYILSFVVEKGHRRIGIGAAMMAKLKDKLDITVAPIDTRVFVRIEITVPETNLPAQKFLQKQNFRCFGLERDFFDKDEHGYNFRYVTAFGQ